MSALAAVLHVLRADTRQLRTYTSGGASLDVPLVAYASEGDPFAPLAGAMAWRRWTSASFSLRQMPGEHFFIHTHPDVLLAQVRRDVEASDQANENSMTFDRSPTEIDLHLRARDQARQHVAPTAERRDHEASWNDAAFVALAALWATAIDADGKALFALFDGLGEGGLDAGFAAACAAHVLAGRVLAGAGTAPGAGLHALVAGDEVTTATLGPAA